MTGLPILLLLAAADPEVSRVIAAVATSQGEARAHAVTSYRMGCRGKNRFAFRNNNAALEALRPVFTDEHAQVRIAALGLTGCYPPETFEQEILSLIHDKDEDVRERAYEEAAHAPSPGITAGLATLVEQCTASLGDMDAKAAHWCVFAAYGLGEHGKTFKDVALKKRIADLSAPLTVSAYAKLREHAMRNLELCGSAAHMPSLKPIIDGEVRPGGQPVSDAERKKAKRLQRKLKKRKG